MAMVAIIAETVLQLFDEKRRRNEMEHLVRAARPSITRLINISDARRDERSLQLGEAEASRCRRCLRRVPGSEYHDRRDHARLRRDSFSFRVFQVPFASLVAAR